MRYTIRTRRAGLLLAGTTGGGAALAAHLPFHIHADAHSDSHGANDSTDCDPAPMPSPTAGGM